MSYNELCKKCILPKNYVSIEMDNSGVCNYCNNYTPINYLGEEKLKEKIDSILKKYPYRKYDCVVGFSGGRDSTYLLWYIVKKLHLKPLAVFIDSGLIPEITLKNIHNITKKLGVDLKIVNKNYLKRLFPIHFNAWIKRPKPETLVTFCVGCRLGVNKFVDEVTIKEKIPIVFYGDSPFEGHHYKSNIVKLNAKSKSKWSFILGYIRQIIQNPFLILNPYSLYIQISEFIVTNSQKQRRKRYNIEKISIFHKYIRWNEKEIEEVLEKELGWNRDSNLNTSYRTDCKIGIIRQYLYYKLLGYNDKDDHLSCLVADGQITREEALERVVKEREVPKETLKSICKESGIEYKKIEKLLEGLANSRR